MSGKHEKFMALAIEEALAGARAGEQPYGAVVVRAGEVVVRTHSLANSSLDPTAHAEVTAVRKAAAKLRTPVLKDCTLYASCEPCPMCCGAILFAAIGTLVIGAPSDEQMRAFGRPKRTYTAEKLAESMNVKLEVIRGVLERDAVNVFEAYKNRS
ncbi:MAG: nucleoside deaminase [Nitrospinota bacterium]